VKFYSYLVKPAQAAIFCLILLAPAFAQTDTTGQISGTVVDTSGGAVTHAAVTAKLEDTGQQYATTTDDQGYFVLNSLRPGAYEVDIRADGFSPFTAQHVVVEVTVSTKIAAQLAPQGTNTTVRVSGEAPVLDTSDPTEGRVIDQQEVHDLPLATRNFQQLLALSPGTNAALTISTELGRGDIDLNVNGQPGTSNNVIIDGIYANSIGTDSTPNLSVPSPDSIQEFIVQTSLYDATTGRNTGGNVALITKSGSNQFHGTAYGFLRATELNANDFLSKEAGLNRGTDDRNVFGGTLGGPIIHDKTFFFISYQGQREHNEICLTSCTFVNNIPSLLTNDRSTAALTAMAAAYGAPLLNPTSLALLQAKLPDGQYAIPSAGRGPVIDGTVSTLLRGLSTYKDDQFDTNFDHTFGDKDHFSGKFFFEDSPEFQANSFFPAANTLQSPGYGSNVDFYNRLLSLNETHAFNASWINDARFGFSRIRAFTSPQEPFTNSQFGITNPLAAQFPGMSTIEVAGLFTLGSEPLADEQSVVETFQWSDYVTWNKGRHTIRFGGDVFRNHTDFYFNFFSRGEILTDQTSCAAYGPGCTSTAIGNFDQFLDGGLDFSPALVPLDPLIGLLGNGVRDRHLRSTDGDIFLQDDIRLTPRLTINLGVRVSEFGGISDTQGLLANFDPQVFLANHTTPCTPAALCQSPDDGFKLAHGNLNPSVWNGAPRVGFAWQAFANKPLVVRGGYGMYYDRFSSRLANLQILNYPYGLVGLGLGAISAPFPDLANVKFPLTPQVPSAVPFYYYGTPLTGIEQTPISGYYVAPNFTAPYDQQYSLGVQYEVYRNWMLEVGYVGSKERKGINVYTINQPGSANSTLLTESGFSANKAFNGLEEAVNSGKSNYNSLQASLTKRIDKHLQFLASYTYSHSLDNGSEAEETELAAEPGDQQNFATQYASSDYDRTHRFVFSGLYDLANPYQGSSSVLKQVVNGWQAATIMTFQTGAPFSVICASGSALNSRADYIGGSYTTSGGTESRLNDYINLAAFSCPISTVPGSGTGPAVDLPPYGASGRNIIRGPGQKNIDFSISKHFPIHEAINLEFRTEFFNLFNWANFGLPNNNLLGGSPGAITVLGSGPRVIQFALKLNF
jgi:Carboxypeptidase regulatory-like domain/TonB-dependent Receptor Plug Domain